MADSAMNWLVYVDRPDWSRARPREWRYYIADDMRAVWPTLTYEQKWRLAQHAAKLAMEAPNVNVNTRRQPTHRPDDTPIDRPDAPIPAGVIDTARGELETTASECGACAPDTTPSLMPPG